MDTSAESFLKPLGPPPAPCEEYNKKLFYQQALIKGLQEMTGEKEKPKDNTMRYIFIVIFIIIILVIIGVIIAAFAVGVNNSNDTSESTTINGQQVARGLFFRRNRPPRGYLNPNVYTGP